MNISTKIVYYILLINTFLFSVTSCVSDSTEKIKSIATLEFNEPLIKTQANAGDVNFKIPTPLELFLVLDAANANYMTDFIHKPLKYKDYYDSYSRAINFGIYTADLAYATVFANNQDALLYFKAAKELATLLGLNEGYGYDVANRIGDNLQHVDSLVNIAADSYEFAVQFLEDQGQTDLLCSILVGGWIEAIYIACHSVKDFDVTNPIIERIADQQLLLENLIAFLKQYKEENNVNKSIKVLQELQEEFDTLYYNEEGILITKQQFVKISNKVSEIRDGFTQTI